MLYYVQVINFLVILLCVNVGFQLTLWRACVDSWLRRVSTAGITEDCQSLCCRTVRNIVAEVSLLSQSLSADHSDSGTSVQLASPRIVNHSAAEQCITLSRKCRYCHSPCQLNLATVVCQSISHHWGCHSHCCQTVYDGVTEVSLLSQSLSAEPSDSGVPVHLTSLRLSFTLLSNSVWRRHRSVATVTVTVSWT